MIGAHDGRIIIFYTNKVESQSLIFKIRTSFIENPTRHFRFGRNLTYADSVVIIDALNSQIEKSNKMD